MSQKYLGRCHKIWGGKCPVGNCLTINLLTTWISKETVSDGGSSKSSEESDQAVPNGVVVAKEEPGVRSLVAAPGAPSVAAPARVEHLVGKVLSASSEGGPPGC